MPASKTIEDDPEEAEIYSLSALHQLHCLVRTRRQRTACLMPPPPVLPSSQP